MDIPIPVIIVCSIYNIFLFQLQYLTFYLSNGRNQAIPFIATALASVAWLYGVGFLIYWGYKFGWLEAVTLFIVVLLLGTLLSLCLWVVCWRILGLTKGGTNITLGFIAPFPLLVAGYFMWGFL